ncbi:hypothetical protein [Streptomyces chrestomyceticus]|uniref:hypothetical protein n=1 Tax=Streptomyces chrestomyceticus TaxID=68185 RepID=UPI0033D26E0F
MSMFSSLFGSDARRQMAHGDALLAKAAKLADTNPDTHALEITALATLASALFQRAGLTDDGRPE